MEECNCSLKIVSRMRDMSKKVDSDRRIKY